MLWAAEKAAELNVASWRPVLWHRSRSVSPRGDGVGFRAKIRTRMIGALLQSRSAWLPEVFPEADPDRAIAAAPEGDRLVLDATGAPAGRPVLRAPLTLAVGPEGGFEARELEALVRAGFAPMSLGSSILRFETAVVAGIAVARSTVAEPAV
jgi:16S rRNA (uracil1498-N3)-methyltransferase